MLSHVLRDTVHIFKEAHMAKLIHLIMTDRLDLQLLLNKHADIRQGHHAEHPEADGRLCHPHHGGEIQSAEKREF